MGDRVYCSLQLLTPVTEAQMQDLIEIIQFDCDDMQPEAGWFGFAEMNWGEMGSEIKEFLTDNKIGFAWYNDGLYDVTAGVLVFDPQSEKQGWFPTVFGEIAITVDTPPSEALEAQYYNSLLSGQRDFKILKEENSDA